MDAPLTLSNESLNQLSSVMQDMAAKAFKDAGTRQQFPPYMNKQEAAKYLHVSVNTLAAWIKEGLEVCMVGNVTRISKVSADKFMQQHTI